MCIRTRIGVPVLVAFTALGVTISEASRAEELLLEEVVVTAQKREQNLQAVPVAVSAFVGAALCSLGLAALIARDRSPRSDATLLAGVVFNAFAAAAITLIKTLLPAERAYALDAAHPGNRTILALALLDRAPERSDEARELLEDVASLTPRPDYRAEDLRIRAQVREKLAEL